MISLPCRGAVLWSEGFEVPSAFTNNWTIGNELGDVGDLVSQWGVVDSAFGLDDPPHAGTHKAYCAAIGYEGGSTINPRYSSTNENWVSMSREFDLTDITNAFLSFWYKARIPDTERFADYVVVSIDDLEVVFDSADTSYVELLPVTPWTLVTFPLDNYLDGVHTLKIEFHNDDQNIIETGQDAFDFEGVYLDDIVISTNDPNPHIVTSDTLPDAITGRAYSRQLQVTNGNGPYTWRVVAPTTLPSWLSLNNGSGLLSGTPQSATNSSSATNYYFTIEVTDNYFNLADTRDFLLAVLQSPTITSQPTNRVGFVGSTVTFSVTATVIPAGTLTYQWRKNGSGIVNGSKYSGVNTPTLTVLSLVTNDAGAYRCDVTDSLDALHPLNSASATLTVTTNVPPPVLSNPIKTNGNFRFTLTGQAGQTYIIQVSTNLTTNSWQNVTNLVATNGTAQFSETITNSRPRRFFRAFKP